MTDPQPEDVSALLTDADRTARGLLTGDAESDALLEHAEAADDLLESADPVSVLEAVGLETLPDGSEPSSIPEAIARGDEAHVDELRRLLHLANLADSDREGEVDESDDEAATEDLEASVAAVRETGAHERVGEDGDDQGDANGAVDAAEERDAVDDDADATAGNGDADSTIESAVRSTLEGIDADLEGLSDRLEAATTTDDDDGASTASGDEDRTDTDAEADDECVTDDEPTAERTDEQNADGDDGLLEPDLDPDMGSGDGIGSGPSSGRGVARHSTVAASPADRPDMRGLARLSTMPKRE
ncbi:hypothetical protein [Natrarchaeobaculum aegyptiacum]|uniref:Uncharacterized protein n=1 Tax=Natrarchaeobaculum aegyptiacum TaxID=745377 RepID=A0A2Z2HU33_9EURY|nr:hypothetical protein [Natrarchaeobaculum aegyptiacum]ARS90333.1 hypothetical protein B1756_11765 [Natrarchaeobaculum aegyptiacum]